MKKFITPLIITAMSAALSVVARQNASTQNATSNVNVTQSSTELPSKGRAPQTENGIGIADVRVYDETGKPVRGIYVHLTSHRSDGFICESWNTTDANGLANLPPLHMGRLTFDVNRRDSVNKITDKSFQKKRVEYPANNLNNVLRITLPKK